METYYSKKDLINAKNNETNYIYDLTDLEEFLEYVPTADVVPRDEVVKIFEEIEEKIEKAAEVQSRIYYGGKRSSEDSCIYVSKISALRGIGIIVEELKEKYTKGGEQK